MSLGQPTEAQMAYLLKDASKLELLSVVGAVHNACLAMVDGILANDVESRGEALASMMEAANEVFKIRRALCHEGADPETGFEL